MDISTEIYYEYRSSVDDMVDFLLSRKFPDFRSISGWSTFSVLLRGDSTTSLCEEKVCEIEKYATELKRKPFDELVILWKEELVNYKQAIEHQISMEEVLHNRRMGMKPDYVYWSKKTDWTLDEAITLFFERDPASINWETIKHFVSHDPFAEKYAEVRDLVLRAKQGRQLNDPTMPGKFVDWTKRNGIKCPDKLVTQVEKRGILIANREEQSKRPILSKHEVNKRSTQAIYESWRKEYRKLKKAHPEKSDTWCSLQISKLAIAKGAASETIRKNMKK